MNLGEKRRKDSTMAARMKEKGVTRTICACPICHRNVSLTNLYNHLGKC
jgi:hypothetical protein